MKKIVGIVMSMLLVGMLGCLAFANVAYCQDKSSLQSITFDGYVYNAKTKEIIENAEIKITPNAEHVIAIEKRSTPETAFSDPQGYYKITCGQDKKNKYTILVSFDNFISEYTTLSGDNRHNNFSLKPHESDSLIKTLYRGNQLYKRKGHLFYLADGDIRRRKSYFRNLHVSNDTVNNFLKAVGIEYTKPKSDEEIWAIIETVWGVLDRIWTKRIPADDSAIMKFATRDDKGEFTGLLSIERMAQTYEKFGFLPKLNCLYEAHDFATLLVRAGIPKNKIAIADCQLAFASASWTHYSVIVYIHNNWYYLDATFARTKSLPKYEDLGSVPKERPGFDYRHPRFITPIPGSSLTGVPLIVADYSKITGIGLSDLAGAYAERAKAWRGEGEYDKAIADYSEFIKLEPDNITGYAFRANMWLNKGDLDKTIADVSEMIKLEPDNASTYGFRGDTWYKNGNYDKAIADFNKFIEIQGDNALIYSYRGKAWHHKKEFDKAIDDYKKALSLDPRRKKELEPLLKRAEAREE